MALTDETPAPIPQEPVSPGPNGQEPAVDFSQMTLEEYTHLMESDEGAEVPPATVHQRSLWETVKARSLSIAQGAVEFGSNPIGFAIKHGPNMVKEEARAVTQGGGALLENAKAVTKSLAGGHSAGKQQEIRKTQEQNLANLESSLDAVLGPQGDDKLANFAGAVTKLGYQLAPAVILGGETAAARLALAGPSYAMTINPYESSLSELAAKAPTKGIFSVIHRLGEANSIQEIDGPLTALWKKSVEGWAVGAAMEGVIFAAKAAWATRTLSNGASSPAAKAEAQAVLDEGFKPSDTPEAVSLKVNEDGTAHVVPEQKLAKAAPIGGRPSPSMEKMIDAVDQIQKAEGVTLETSVAGSNTLEVKLLKNEGTVKGAGSDALKQLTALADEHGITLKLNASPLEQEGRAVRSAESLRDYYREQGQFEQVRPGKADMVREPGAQPNEFREVQQGPKLDIREASAQAATMNFANKVMSPASAASDAINTHLTNFENALNSGDPQAVADAVSAPMNLGVAGSPEEIRAQLDKIAKGFTETLTKAEGAGISVDKVMKQAAILRGSLSEDQLLLALYKSNLSQHENTGLRAAAQAMIEGKGEALHRLSMLAQERPNDPALIDATKTAWLDWLRTLEATTAFDTEAGRTVRYLSENTGESLLRQQTTEGAIKELQSSGGQSSVVAGMQTRDVKAVQTLFRISGGKPKNFYATLAGAKVYIHTGKIANAMFYMKAMMLSGPATFQTIAVSGSMLNHYYASMRMFGPLFNGDLAAAREGGELLWGLWSNSGRALKASVAAAEQGHSIINPQPVHLAAFPNATEKAAIGGASVAEAGQVTPGKINNLFQIPGKLAGSQDEFNRAAAYYSYIDMMGAKEARALYPNDAQKFAAHVASVRDASIDPATGAATVPEALAWAERGTLQAPLREGTLGKGLSDAVRGSALQIFAPFVRSGGNGLDAMWQMMPYLQKFNPEVKAAMAAGGAQAAEVSARAAATTSIFVGGMAMAASGRITGAGPSNPGARHVWLQDHEPFSIDVSGDGDWVSYTKSIPFSHALGTIASAWEGLSVNFAQGRKSGIDQYIASTASAIYNNTAETAYLSGVHEGMEAFKEGGNTFNAWLESAGMMAYPRLVQGFNTDPVQRLHDGFIERVRGATPVLSETLPPAYNWLGEYQYTPAGMGGNAVESFSNKNSFFKHVKKGKDPIGDEVLSMQHGYEPMARSTADGNIDLASEKYRNQEGELPWDYMNKIYREGWGSRPGVREALRKQFDTDAYKAASAGTAEYPGGERYKRISAIVEGYRGAVLAETRKHFKSFDDDMRAYEKAQAGSMMKPTNPRRDALLKLYQFNR